MSILSIDHSQVSQASADLINLLGSDLNFHDSKKKNISHNFHSFPAKFPPELPRKFIDSLTLPGDIVLDPMNGSGTTTLEAFLSNRKALGFDIDPLAIKIAKVKTTPIDIDLISSSYSNLINRVYKSLSTHYDKLNNELEMRFDEQSKKFIDYWFGHDTQIELLALIEEIEKIEETEVRNFFELAFSSIIITKNGGVSLALDLAHTRPHRVKMAIREQSDNTQYGLENDKKFKSIKRIKPALEEFEKKVVQNIKSLSLLPNDQRQATILYGNAEFLPIEDNFVDLIVTSPPYAFNAIDYMRAHKFSLVWMGIPIEKLSKIRGEYIGGEAINNFDYEELPIRTKSIVGILSDKDHNKAIVLHRYYSEMTRVLKEMFRVLKPGKPAIMVIGSSVVRNEDLEVQNSLAEIGKSIGFKVPAIGIRELDRNRRMLPIGNRIDKESQIQQRMQKEFVIGFLKP